MYNSFGNLIASAGNSLNPIQYTAREFDSETHLYYYRARYYDPQVGRFMSEDPARFRVGINFFKYAQNDPQDFNDPTGLYALQGFTAEQQVEMMNAIEEVKAKLKGCPSCVNDPKLRDKLAGFLAGGNNGSGVKFVFKEKLAGGTCGQTRGITNTTFIANWKTNPGCDCLPKTIIHELVHQTWQNMLTPPIEGWDEKVPDSIDRECFPYSKCKKF